MNTKDPIKSADGTSMHPFVRTSSVFYNGQPLNGILVIKRNEDLNAILPKISAVLLNIATFTQGMVGSASAFESTGDPVTINHNLNNQFVIAQVHTGGNLPRSVVTDAEIEFVNLNSVSITVPAGSYYILIKPL